MALYINNGKHPNVYKNKKPVSEPNQNFSKIDRLSEYMAEQQRVNRALSNKYSFLNQYQKQQNNRQDRLQNQLQELNKKASNYDSFKEQILERLRVLEGQSYQVEKWIKGEQNVKVELVDQVKKLNETNQEIKEQLHEQDLTKSDILEQMDQLIEAHQRLSDQIVDYDKDQKRMVERIENQEALMEKVLRQMLNLRSIFYERSHHLADKIEDHYELTSTYFHKMLTGKDQPLTLLMDQKDKEDSKKG
ncbi:coiled-coil domain-containing protein [Alkalibacillus aidingensis]|uniref:hypothetical protein n=1 Tax=Alkalibacillus aidingensis TaxID=2747607 RepID=UPI0016609F37|nr:hypothetical protein [Alkalibacillus aidingensis]